MVDIAVEKVIPGIIAIMIIFALGYYGVKQVPGLSKSLFGYDPFEKEADEGKQLVPQEREAKLAQLFSDVEICLNSKDIGCRCKLPAEFVPKAYFLSFEKKGFDVHASLNYGIVETGTFLRTLTPKKKERDIQRKTFSDVTLFIPEASNDPYVSSLPGAYKRETNEFFIENEVGNILVKSKLTLDYTFGGLFKRSRQEVLVYPQGTSLSSKPLCSEPPQHQTQPVA